MEKVFEDYLNKKNVIQSGQCCCGQECYIFVEDYSVGRVTVCQKCGKKIFFVQCGQCQSGFSLHENSKEISSDRWKCAICDYENFGLPTEQVKNYLKKELPKEIIKKEGLNVTLLKVFIAGIGLTFIIRKVIELLTK